MDRRNFVSGLITAGAILKFPTGTTATPFALQRKIWDTSEERLREILSLIPDTERFRGLMETDLRWVDANKQADAWNSSLSDTLLQGHWPPYSGIRRLIVEYGITVDQMLSMEGKTSDGLSDGLGVWSGADAELLIELLRGLEFEELQFGDITALVQRQPDLKSFFLDAYYRFFAVLKSQNVLVIASSYELILEYCASMISQNSRMNTGVDVITMELLREGAWTQQWLPGKVLDKSSARFPDGPRYSSLSLSSQTIETIRGLEHLEYQKFGVPPKVVRFSIGQDAGFHRVNLRNSEEPPRPLAEGYDNEPMPFIRLQYESESEALLACDIIEWRWENALSWLSGEPLSDSVSPREIDRSEVSTGIITQEFSGRRDFFLQQTAELGDLSIYGWGTL